MSGGIWASAICYAKGEPHESLEGTCRLGKAEVFMDAIALPWTGRAPEAIQNGPACLGAALWEGPGD